MEISLSYGRDKVMFAVPDRTVIPVFTEPEYRISREGFVADLQQLLPSDKDKYNNIAIVVSDKTRLCGYPEYLPWLTATLIERGADKANICFYIAYGTHARQTEAESLASYGETYRQYRFVHHNCDDGSLFVQVGTTSRGTPVDVRKDILNSTLLITFGSVSHHYFAGYGGGRKLIFPGLGSRKAVYHNHGLFLDRQTRSLATGCQPGNLEGNPLADDLREFDTFLPHKISIHGIMNASGKVCQLTTGDSYGQFVDACKLHDSYYRYSHDGQFDLVIASSGGYPKDINFIQAHKSVHHAAAFVRDGGKLVVLSECVDGIGSNYFMKYLEAGSFEAAFAMLEQHYEGNGGTALSMMLKTKRIQIHMLTSLGEAVCRTLGVKRVDKDAVQQIIDRENGSIAAISNASMLVK